METWKPWRLFEEGTLPHFRQSYKELKNYKPKFDKGADAYNQLRAHLGVIARIELELDEASTTRRALQSFKSAVESNDVKRLRDTRDDLLFVFENPMNWHHHFDSSASSYYRIMTDLLNEYAEKIDNADRALNDILMYTYHHNRPHDGLAHARSLFARSRSYDEPIVHSAESSILDAYKIAQSPRVKNLLELMDSYIGAYPYNTGAQGDINFLKDARDDFKSALDAHALDFNMLVAWTQYVSQRIDAKMISSSFRAHGLANVSGQAYKHLMSLVGESIKQSYASAPYEDLCHETLVALDALIEEMKKLDEASARPRPTHAEVLAAIEEELSKHQGADRHKVTIPKELIDNALNAIEECKSLNIDLPAPSTYHIDYVRKLFAEVWENGVVIDEDGD